MIVKTYCCQWIVCNSISLDPDTGGHDSTAPGDQDQLGTTLSVFLMNPSH